jgi:hypothetical protein
MDQSFPHLFHPAAVPTRVTAFQSYVDLENVDLARMPQASKVARALVVEYLRGAWTANGRALRLCDIAQRTGVPFEELLAAQREGFEESGDIGA